MRIDFPDSTETELKISIRGELVAEVWAGANQAAHVGHRDTWEKEILEARTATSFYRWACQAFDAITDHAGCRLTKYKTAPRTETSLAEAFLRGLSGKLTPGSYFGMPGVEYAARIVYEPCSPESELCSLGSAMAMAVRAQAKHGFPRFEADGQGVMDI